MTENESVSEMEGIEYQPSVDSLSDLPLSIIHIILGHLPFREAVRTSILSREWRYTCASLPHIVIDKTCANPVDISRNELEDCSVDESCANPEDNSRDEPEDCSPDEGFADPEDESRDELEDFMEDVITHVLSNHKGPIHKFQMSFRFENNCPDVDEWILCLSRNDVKELVLDMGYPRFQEPLQVHSSLYSCEKLTALELHNWELELDPPPSTFKGFLFLRRLCLYDVRLSSDAVETLVANSPLLERLSLVESETSELRINAPNLKYLYIMGGYMKAEIRICAPLLAELIVLFSHYYIFFGEPQQKRPSCHYTDFLGGFTNLEKLTAQHDFVNYLSVGIESCYRTLVFPHLKEIELNDVNFEDIKEISAIARLITGAPNLYKLRISESEAARDTPYLQFMVHISVLFYDGLLVVQTNLADKYEKDYASDSESPDICFGDFGCAPGFTFAKLRFIDMIDVRGYPSEAEFMVFLLQSSPVLEEMYVDHSCARDDWERTLLVDKLVGCGWASPTAELYTPKSTE